MTVRELKKLKQLSRHTYAQVKQAAHREACGKWEKKAIEHDDLIEIANVITRAESYGKLGNEIFMLEFLVH